MSVVRRARAPDSSPRNPSPGRALGESRADERLDLAIGLGDDVGDRGLGRGDRDALAAAAARELARLPRDLDGDVARGLRRAACAPRYRRGIYAPSAVGAMAVSVEPCAQHTHDVVIVGGGHNALVAAAYLARAGLGVVVLERLDHLGGAAVSERPWAGVDARLSRYSYLVSLLPRAIIDDLGLRIDLRRRRYSSYTPDPARPRARHPVDTADAAATAASFARDHRRRRARPTGSPRSRIASAPLARHLFPTVTEPLADAVGGARAPRRRRAVGRPRRAAARRRCCARRSRPTSRAASR